VDILNIGLIKITVRLKKEIGRGYQRIVEFMSERVR